MNIVGHSAISNEISITERYRGYANYKEEVVKGPLKLLWDSLPNLLLCCSFYSLKEKRKNNILLNIFLIGVIITNLFITFSISSRFSLYCLAMQLVLVPFFYSNRKIERIRLYSNVYVFYLFFYFVYVIYIAYQFGIKDGRHDIVPYTFYLFK